MSSKAFEDGTTTIQHALLGWLNNEHVWKILNQHILGNLQSKFLSVHWESRMSSLTKGTLPGFYDKLWLYGKVKWGGDIGLLMLDPFMLVGLPPAAYTET